MIRINNFNSNYVSGVRLLNFVIATMLHTILFFKKNEIRDEKEQTKLEL